MPCGRNVVISRNDAFVRISPPYSARDHVARSLAVDAMAPALLATLDQPGDNPAVLTHLRGLLETYGERALVNGLAGTESRETPTHRERLRELLVRLGVSIEGDGVVEAKLETAPAVPALDKIWPRVFKEDNFAGMTRESLPKQPSGNGHGRGRPGSGVWLH